MKPFILVTVLCLSLISLSASHLQVVAASDQTIVTAAQVNGTWRTDCCEFKIWALGKQRLRIEFAGTYEYESQAGPMANEGAASGIAHIEGDTAIFRPDGVDEDCTITLKFRRNKLIVTQDGNCGFGLNVTADGTYKKVNGNKPKFGNNESG